MKTPKYILSGFILIISLLFPCRSLHAQNANASIWVSAYYAGWMQGYHNTGYLPAEKVDYSAVTHIMHFAVTPNGDGSLDDAGNGVDSYNANALITLAHAAGKKVIIVVGGAGALSGLQSASTAGTRPTFINNLIALMTSRGYDGIDIDWEPLSSSDAPAFQALATDLRARMDAITPRPLLTCALGSNASQVAPVQAKFDQINIMTYDMSGAWSGWVTWHNSPLSNGGNTFPGGGQLPCIQNEADNFISGGIATGKIGVGIDFYGFAWSGGSGTPTGGVTAPQQSWTSAPTVKANVPYYTIMSSYYSSANHKWDANAQAPYLSIDNSGSSSDMFISYDDEQSSAAKISYAKSKGLGGVIIWELGGGYLAGNAKPDAMLQAIKAAAFGATPSVGDTIPPAVVMTSPANGSTVSGKTMLKASANDNNKLICVQFELDGVTLSPEISVSPYSYSWSTTSVANGAHTIIAIARDSAGNTSTDTVAVSVANGPVSGVGDAGSTAPGKFQLEQNYPNPFNPATSIRYTLPAAAKVTLTVYNMLGQEVASLVNGTQQAGSHAAIFDASSVASGVYLYRLTAVSAADGAITVQTQRMQLVK